MNNSDVEVLLRNCDDELTHIDSIIQVHGGTSLIVPYLNKYSVIRSCGTIEVAFKTIIADYCSRRSKPQVKHFLTKRIREASSNPSYKNIIQTLKQFDGQWAIDFKGQMKSLSNYPSVLISIQSLVDARNDFAHGGNPTITFTDARRYYSESKSIITTLDDVVC